MKFALRIGVWVTLILVAGCQQNNAVAQQKAAAKALAQSEAYDATVKTVHGEQHNVKIAVVNDEDVDGDSDSGSADGSANKVAPPAASLAHEDLDAAAWVQTSAEYRAIARQTYLMATQKLQAAKDDPAWTAYPAQQDKLNDGEGNPFPPAVILDLDETVLNNGGFQSELIVKGQEYSPDIWNAWVESEQALAIDGAKEFLEACRAAGITTFFVSNREAKVETSTSNNLKSLGMIPADAPDTILSKYEKEEWGSNKEPRREHVARTHRILMIVGDDLNDFVIAGKTVDMATRHKLTDSHVGMWGEKWFVIPNPNYGSWERSIYEFNDFAPRETKLREKRERLIPMKHAESDKKAA